MQVLGIEIREGSWVVVPVTATRFNIQLSASRLLEQATDELRLDGLKSIMNETGMKDARISVVLPRQSAITKLLRVPAPGLAELDGIVRFEIEKHIPFALADTYYAYQVVRKEQNVYTVLLTAARKDAVDGVTSMFARAGLEPECVSAWQPSMYNAMYHLGRIPEGKNVAVICLNGRRFSVDTFADTVPVYSNRLACTGSRQSESIPVIERELKYSICSLGGNAAAKRLDVSIILSDEPAELSLLDSLRADLNIPDITSAIKDFERPYSTAPATGAALALTGKARLNINLAPAKTSEASAATVNFTMIASVVVLLLLAAALVSYTLRDSLELKRINEAVEGVRAESESVQRLADELKTAEARSSALMEIEAMNRPGPLEVLKELTTVLPMDTYLKSMEYNSGVVTIEGKSSRASSLLIRMEKSDSLKEFEFSGPVTKTDDGKEHFRLRFKVRDYDEVSSADLKE